MPQGTFSQQIQAQQPQQQQYTRTQRKASQYQSQLQFQALQNEANRLQNTEFKGITFEQYQQKYATLSPEIKQFFQSPQEIIAGQESQKQVEREKLSTFISNTQQQLDAERLKLQRYNESSHADSEGRARFDLTITMLEDRVRYANEQAGKINEGARSVDIQDYAVDKADYNKSRAEDRTKQIQEFSKQVKTGEYFFEQDLLKVGLNLKTATLPKYIEAVEKYNTVTLPQLQQQQKADLQAWQQKNPTEKLIFDKQGNVTGVESGVLQGSYTPQAYDLAVIKYTVAQDKALEERKTYLAEFIPKFTSTIKAVSFNAPVSKFQTGVNVFTAGYLATPFGTSVALKENRQTILTAERERSIREGWNIFSPMTLGERIVKATGFLPLDTSYRAIQEEQASNYRAEQKKKLYDELTKEISIAPPEIQPYVQEEGFKLLREYGGIDYEVVNVGKFKYDQENLFGKVTSPNQSVKEISSSEFPSVISSQKVIETGWYQGLSPTANKVLGQPVTLEVNISPQKLHMTEAGRGTMVGDLPETDLNDWGYTKTGKKGYTPLPEALQNPTLAKRLKEAFIEGGIKETGRQVKDVVYNIGKTIKGVIPSVSATEIESKPTLSKVEIPRPTGVESLGSEIVITDTDFQRSISQNMLELEREYTKQGDSYWGIGTGLVLTRQYSTKALEFYGISKGIGFVGGKAIKLGKTGYEMLGGGLKLGEVSARAGMFTTTVVPTTLTTGEKIALTTGKIGLGAGLTGLYGVQSYKQYQSDILTSPKVGKVSFLTGKLGEISGFGLVIGEGAYHKYNQRRINELIRQENMLKEWKKTGIQNIEKYGQFSDKAMIRYKQIGTGKLSENQFKIISEQTGIPEKILREKSMYRTTLSIEDSNVPVIQRAINYFRTGKSTSGTTTFEASRYGFVDTINTGDKVFEKAYEFNLRGTKVSNLQLKTTIADEQYALTSIFQKTRPSKASPEEIFNLKETVLTQIKRMKAGETGDIKVSLTETENRLLNVYPYGTEKLSLKEAIKLGTATSNLDNFEQLLAKTGDFGKSAEFINLRYEAPLFKGVKGLKFNIEGETQFFQMGTGRRSVPMKNVLYNLEQAGYFKELAKIGKKVTPTVYFEGTGVEDVGTISTQTLKTETLKGSLKSLMQQNVLQISPTVQSFNLKTSVRLKDLVTVSDVLGLKIGTSVATETALLQKTRQKQQLKQDLQTRSAQVQMNKLEQDLGVKQLSAQKYRQATVTDLMPKLETPRFRVPDVLVTPFPRPPRIPKPTYAGFPFMDNLKGKILQKKRKRKKGIEIQALFPDFTARALGLSPKSLSVKDAMKEIRKIQTGFEVRRGARIKGYSPIDEKSLLRGIMK